MNVQFAIYEGEIYVLEVNPRASRTVPFIAKAVGRPLAGIAARLMAGETLDSLDFVEQPEVPAVFVKVPVFPFRRFPGVDPILGPEMKSTGEVMGVGRSLGEAFAKAWLGAGHRLPLGGTAFVSVIDRDKPAAARVAAGLSKLGFALVATAGTAEFLRARGLEVGEVLKIHEGRPHVGDRMINREIDLVINTPIGQLSHLDDSYIRETALKLDIPCITTLSGARAVVEAIAALKSSELEVRTMGSLGEPSRRPVGKEESRVGERAPPTARVGSPDTSC